LSLPLSQINKQNSAVGACSLIDSRSDNNSGNTIFGYAKAHTAQAFNKLHIIVEEILYSGKYGRTN